MSATDPRHLPVLCAEAVAAAAPAAGQRIVDLTFGAGGYSAAFLAAGADVIAFDRDPTAIVAGRHRFATMADRLTLVQRPFDQLEVALEELGIANVDAVVGDYGVSSMQLDQGERGFSFMADGPLDMRMGDGPTVADLLAEVDEADLANIIYQYGEDRQSRRLAKMIVTARDEAPLTTTGQLAAIAEKALGQGAKIHPATRLFQGLRIFINDELGQILRVLMAAERVLIAGGRLVAVSFHSLEDRLVKRFLAAASGKADTASRHMPQGTPTPASFSSLSKAIRPSAAEVAANPRARSAIMRSALRTDVPPLEWTPQRLQSLGVPPMVFSSLQQSWGSVL